MSELNVNLLVGHGVESLPSVALSFSESLSFKLFCQLFTVTVFLQFSKVFFEFCLFPLEYLDAPFHTI